MSKMPWDKFRGKIWDENGNPVRRDQSPGDVRGLPPLVLEEGESLPNGVVAKLLGGNWYGDGPMIFLWDEVNEVQTDFPLWARTQMPFYLGILLAAAKQKRNGTPLRDGGFYVKGSEGIKYRDATAKA